MFDDIINLLDALVVFFESVSEAMAVTFDLEDTDAC